MPKANAEISAGVCGFSTQVKAHLQGEVCQLAITSDCKAIQRLAEELTKVNPFQEISFKREMPQTYELGIKYCSHAACPVPAGIIKAVEIASGLALPKDVTIKLTKADE